MGFFLLICMAIGVWVAVSSGKVSANFNGENVCQFCKKRVKFAYGTGHYATVCPRCGKTQVR